MVFRLFRECFEIILRLTGVYFDTQSTPVEDIPVAKTRADNGWRCSNDLIPTAVAGFISIWALDIRDRHQGNMILTETGSGPAPVSFANIDFGWVESVFNGRILISY